MHFKKHFAAILILALFVYKNNAQSLVECWNKCTILLNNANADASFNWLIPVLIPIHQSRFNANAIFSIRLVCMFQKFVPDTLEQTRKEVFSTGSFFLD